ncbi:hypothetical protein [Jeongeupia chitinilytica]|uniref:DUF1871 family protein n=1 Tax=Jeongeupia chitinilytica TaxID=1041641 RepID=A0ABQ3GZ81_9NEIS|nr:hypothetical protein [Jeongeupia chitinilytica]GHD58617.1 hypothetical protein GCM10007350_08760 [Jeongeupia chitinilytica]
MGTKLSPQELELYLALDVLLFKEWDPIGVSEFTEEVDAEYRAYLPRIFSIVMEDAAPEEVANHLNQIQTERMELPANIQHCLRIAEKAFELKWQAGL